VFAETEIEVQRDVPEDPEKVFNNEELLIRLIDQLPGPPEVSLVVKRMWLVVVGVVRPVALVRFQFGTGLHAPPVLLLADSGVLGFVVVGSDSIAAVDVCMAWLDALSWTASPQRLSGAWVVIDP
jgi:hypothetical protein